MRARGVEVELFELHALLGDPASRQHFEAFEQRLRLAAAVGLDEADDDLPPLGLALARGFEHGIGLAHAGAHPEEELQASPPARGFLLLREAQQLLGGWPAFVPLAAHDVQRWQGAAGITRQEIASFLAMSPTLIRPSTTSALR